MCRFRWFTQSLAILDHGLTVTVQVLCEDNEINVDLEGDHYVPEPLVPIAL